MQDKNKFAVYVFLVMLIAAIGLKVINFYTKTGKVIIKNETFKVEVLKNEWELERGLSGRDKLAKNKGALFVFSKEDKHSFWMKGMKFPIDIVWIKNNKIVDIKERLPIPITQYYKSYTPTSSVRYVLEINAGLSEKYGFETGDEVLLDI